MSLFRSSSTNSLSKALSDPSQVAPFSFHSDSFQKKHVKGVFKSIDKDKNGSLDKGEFRDFIQSLLMVKPSCLLTFFSFYKRAMAKLYQQPNLTTWLLKFLQQQMKMVTVKLVLKNL